MASDSQELRAAAYHGDWDTVLTILTEKPRLALHHGKSGFTALHQAAFHKASPEIIHRLLNAGLQPALSMKSSHGQTPLDIAKENGSVATYEALENALNEINESKCHDLEYQPYETSNQEKFQACMLLSAVGDAIGYRRARWEFNSSAESIQRELVGLGGIQNLVVDQYNWIVSDDTVQHLATAEALISANAECVVNPFSDDFQRMCALIADHYVLSFDDMDDRAPGNTCARGVHWVKTGNRWNTIPLSESNTCGCGSAMRAMCIGLLYNQPGSKLMLVATSVESARTSHHHLAGMYSAVAVAGFTALALDCVSVQFWPRVLLNELLPLTDYYIARSGRPVPSELAERQGNLFKNLWENWLSGERMTIEQANDPIARDEYYNRFGFGWDASSSVFIAFEAFRLAGSSWENLALYSGIHGGDSDSTFCIAGSWYGSMYGNGSAPVVNYDNLEYRDRIIGVSESLFQMNQIWVNNLKA